jgi:hypothetical protein
MRKRLTQEMRRLKSEWMEEWMEEWNKAWFRPCLESDTLSFFHSLEWLKLPYFILLEDSQWMKDAKSSGNWRNLNSWAHLHRERMYPVELHSTGSLFLVLFLRSFDLRLASPVIHVYRVFYVDFCHLSRVWKAKARLTTDNSSNNNNNKRFDFRQSE